MRDSDKFDFCVRIFLEKDNLFPKLLSTNLEVDPDPMRSREGSIVGVISLSPDSNIDELVRFIEENRIDKNDIDFFISFFSEYDENIVPIPDWIIEFYKIIPAKELLFNYTTAYHDSVPEK